MRSSDSDNSGNPIGRPRKGEGPRLPYEEIDRVLVFGDVVPCDDGKNTTVVYPSYRDLGRRYGVSHSLIADYAKKHNCMRRREVAQARIEEKTDQKLVELRATARAMSKDDELRIIDSYLAGFEKALSEGRVRFDNPGDFNTMVRLKEFVQGGADSRQEVHAILSLEELQARHRRMMKTLEASRTEELDEVNAVGSLLPGGHQETGENPPPPSFEADPEEVSGHFVEGTVAGHVGPRRAANADPDDGPEPGDRGRHGANVGPTRARAPAHPDPEDDDEAEE
jgi:hypothetical protein